MRQQPLTPNPLDVRPVALDGANSKATVLKIKTLRHLASLIFNTVALPSGREGSIIAARLRRIRQTGPAEQGTD